MERCHRRIPYFQVNRSDLKMMKYHFIVSGSYRSGTKEDQNPGSKPMLFPHDRLSVVLALKRKCHFDKIIVTGCTGSCQIDNFRCCQWRKFCQNDNNAFPFHRSQIRGLRAGRIQEALGHRLYRTGHPPGSGLHRRHLGSDLCFPLRHLRERCLKVILRRTQHKLFEQLVVFLVVWYLFGKLRYL